MADLLKDLQQIIESRKEDKEGGSYTAYLFETGLDKILKKIGEESSEIIIGAKEHQAVSLQNNEAKITEAKDELIGEIGDLLYHLSIMMNERGISFEEVDDLLRGRMQKQSNLKEMKKVDKNT